MTSQSTKLFICFGVIRSKHHRFHFACNSHSRKVGGNHLRVTSFQTKKLISILGTYLGQSQDSMSVDFGVDTRLASGVDPSVDT